MQTLKGLIGNILKQRGSDCSLGGISSRCHEVVIVGLGTDAEIFEATDDRPAVRIVKRQLTNHDEPYMHIEPLEPGQWAFGGTVVDCCDSRFSEVSTYPLHFHDRNLQKERH